MSKLATTWVFCDNASRLPELMGAAAQLGNHVSALVCGSAAEVRNAHALGADTVYALGELAAGRIIEDYAATLAYVIKQGEQPGLVLLPATRRGKALAAKLGVKLQAGVFNDAAEITLRDGAVCAKHMVYGGLAFGEEKITSALAVVTVSSGVFAAAVADSARTGATVDVAFIAPPAAIVCVERRVKPGSSVDLGKARRVVSVGRGIGKQECIQLAAELSAVLEAELGCSRPVAENEKWMERERYVGISGIVIKPELYLALGISGQIQHMVGANGAQTLVAINKDKKAPIFQYADYGLVGDLFKVVPALITAFKK